MNASQCSPISLSVLCSECNMFCYDSSVCRIFTCNKCISHARLTGKILELEARIETLQNIRSIEDFID